MVHSMYKLTKPLLLAEAPPFSGANDCPTTPAESVDGKDGTPLPTMGNSDAELDKTNLEPEEDSSYSAQALPSKSDRTLRKWTRDKPESKDSQDRASSLKRAVVKKEIDDDESPLPSGLSDETLRDHRFTVNGKDSPAVHEVRAKILGLKAGMRPSRQDIDLSPIFALRRAADESGSPSIIGKDWVPHLKQRGHLADCKPKDFSYKDGWMPLYMRAGITKHLSGLESLLNRDKTSPLIAVVLPEMEFQYEWEYVIHNLHKSESLNQTSITYDTNQRKQIAFCPYCGVMNENTVTAHSHMRKHLGKAFLCGGCYIKIKKKPQYLYNHMLSCLPTVIH